MSLADLTNQYPEFMTGRTGIEFDYVFSSDEDKAKKD